MSGELQKGSTLAPPSSRELSWYALGSVPAGIGALAWTFMIFYYNQVLGIPASLIGIVAVAVSGFDALSDPVVGAISDRTRGRWGRRHRYLLLAAVPSALTFYLVWAPPAGLAVTGLLAFLLVVHLVKRLVDTFYFVPYLALGAEISTDYETRTRITTLRGIYFHVGRAVAGAALLLVFLRPTAEYPDGQLNPEAYPRFAAVFGLIILVTLLASAWKTRSWIGRLSEASPEESGGIGRVYRDFRDALAYRSFRAILFGSVSRHIAWGMSDSLGIYMATYFWKISTDMLFFWGVGMFTGLFVGLPFWRDFSRRFDKKPICMLGDGIYLFFFCIPYLLKIVGFWPDHDSALYIPAYVLTTGFLAHFGIAASGVLTGSMLGDITDLDELEHGKRREGVIFGAESFTWKALTGVGPLVAGIVIDLVGLREGVAPENVPGSVATALGLAQGGVMSIFFGLAVLFISRYDLNRARHDRILASLEERSQEPLPSRSS